MTSEFKFRLYSRIIADKRKNQDRNKRFCTQAEQMIKDEVYKHVDRFTIAKEAEEKKKKQDAFVFKAKEKARKQFHNDTRWRNN